MPTHRIVALACLLFAFAGCATRPDTTTPPTLLLVSVDGLRPADITAERMPALNALGDAGVRAEGMRPSYPSLTFPNHYAMVTGLRPDRHGIVHNSMSDRMLGKFRTSDRGAVENGAWWGARPVWVSVEKAGLRVVGVFQWGLEEKTNAGNAALTGLGNTRRIILGDTIIKDYSQDEIIAVLAHEIGHYKHRDMARLIAAGSLLAAGGFYLAHLFLQRLVAMFGFAGPDDIGSFPIFVFCLLVFSLVTMPVSNAYSRRREYAADAYAVASLGSSGALVSALEKLAAQNLADREPPAWIEFLLHSHPSISRRVRRAREMDPSPR